MTSLTTPQRHYLDEIVAAGTKRYNGRSRRPVETLEKLGLIEYEYDLHPRVTSRWTESYTCKPTQAGIEFIRVNRTAEMGLKLQKRRGNYYTVRLDGEVVGFTRGGLDQGYTFTPNLPGMKLGLDQGWARTPRGSAEAAVMARKPVEVTA